MDIGHPEVREDLLLELGGVLRHGLPVVSALLTLGYLGTDNVGLPPLPHQPAQELINPGMVAAVYKGGLDGPPPRRELVDDGHVQIPVEDQGQGPGDGRGGHDQGMGVFPLPRQGRPLPNAEAVLLVRHHQPQSPVFHPPGDEGVGAHHKVDLPRRQARGQGLFLFRGMGPREQGAADSQRLHQGGQALVMLPGQNLRGGHQRRLAAVFHREVHAGGGHHGLAAAHVPLTKAVHGPAGGHVPQGLLHTSALGLRQGEGERAVKRPHVHGAEGLHLHGPPPLPQPPEAQGEEEQLLKGQPPPGQLQGLTAGGEVDVLIGVAHPAELVLPPDLVRQDVGQNIPAGVQPLADGPGEDHLADSGGEGVDGDNAARGLPPSLRLHHGIRHPAAEQVPLRPAIEDVGLPRLEAVFQPGLVEEGHIQGPRLVHRPDLYQVQALANVGHRGGRGDHGGDAGGFAGDQVRDAAGFGPVLIPPGEPGNQVPEGVNAQLSKGLGPLLADALDIAHVRF